MKKNENLNQSPTVWQTARARGLKAALAAVAVGGASVESQAALDTNITGIVTDLTGFFGDIQTLVISVVVFGLAIGYAKLLSRK